MIRVRERSLRAKADRAGLREEIVATAGDRIHVWHGGDGPPLLLLHGFGARALWQWHDQLAAFAEHHTVVMPDLLGFGGSSSPAGDPSLEHQVAAMLGVLDHLGLEQVDLVGMSYGGLVAWSMAIAHPSRVGRLVLVDSPGHAWSADEERAMLDRFGVESAEALLVPQTPAGIRTLARLAWYRRTPIPDWAARQAIEALYDPHRDDQIALLRHLESDIDAYAAAARRPTAPTLLVWGAHDEVFPIAVAHRLARELPATLVTIDRARHMPNAEHPRRFNAAVLAFLAE